MVHFVVLFSDMPKESKKVAAAPATPRFYPGDDLPAAKVKAVQKVSVAAVVFSFYLKFELTALRLSFFNSLLSFGRQSHLAQCSSSCRDTSEGSDAFS